jgi:TPR repeat protein
MVVVDRLIGLASPRAALRRSMRLREKGRVAEAFRLLSVAAKAGIADAEYRVARCYLEGAGVPPSRSESARWLARAATHGCIEAQVLLSALCVRGLANMSSSVATAREDRANRLFASDAPADPDFEGARKWAHQAALGGSAEGQALLAYILTSGPEPMRDVEEAHRWYERSAAAGCPQGHLGYALSLARRATDEEGRRQTVEQLRRAAEAELPTAI